MVGVFSMAMTRRNFIKTMCLAGVALLLKACTRADEPPRDLEPWQPAFAKLEAEGKLAERVEQAYRIFEKCELCPNRCGMNRRKGQRGICCAPEKAMVYSHHPHFGEELPLVGQEGSGTIFFFQLQSSLRVLPELAHFP